MGVAIKRLTWEDIKELPESAGRTELVDGELVVSPTPATRHQLICTLLGAELTRFVQREDLGVLLSSPMHTILDEHVHYEPDLCFVSKDRLSIFGEEYIAGPPGLIIEVISESNRSHDTVVKFHDYERYGVREYWLVDPRENHIRVYELKHGEYVLHGLFQPGDEVTSVVLSGLQLDPGKVLAIPK